MDTHIFAKDTDRPETLRPQPHICHVTVLNPVRHPRIFYKQALSQLNWGFKVSVIGADDETPAHHHLGVHCVSNGGAFNAPIWRRRMMALRAIRLASEMHADVYVIHTPELIPWISNIRSANPTARFVYDIHENYLENFQASGFPRRWFASRVRSIERKFIQELCTGIQLAEYCYQDIFGGLTSFVVLPNTFAWCPEINQFKARPNENAYALFTGTFSADWGIDVAGEISSRLQLPLIIAGSGKYTPPNMESQILMGGETFVPYPIIQWLQLHAQVILAPYRISPRLANKIPTKFYEAIALGKPVIIPDHPLWLNWLGSNGLKMNNGQLRDQLHNWKVSDSCAQEIFWEDSAARMGATWAQWFPDLF